jgi:hypothetical protein
MLERFCHLWNCESAQPPLAYFGRKPSIFSVVPCYTGVGAKIRDRIRPNFIPDEKHWKIA